MDLICRIHAFMQRTASLRSTCIPRRLAERRRLWSWPCLSENGRSYPGYRAVRSYLKNLDRANETRPEGFAMAVILTISAQLLACNEMMTEGRLH